jgi:hypothetical protein
MTVENDPVYGYLKEYRDLNSHFSVQLSSSPSDGVESLLIASTISISNHQTFFDL